MLLQRWLCAGTRCSRPWSFWTLECAVGPEQKTGTNPHAPGLCSEARAVSCCWPRMEIPIPRVQQKSGSHCNCQDSGDLKNHSGIWRSNCSSLYSSILNLHLLYAKHVPRWAAVQRMTISGRSSWLNTVLISLFPIPFWIETKASFLQSISQNWMHEIQTAIK